MTWRICWLASFVAGVACLGVARGWGGPATWGDVLLGLVGAVGLLAATSLDARVKGRRS